MASEKTDGIVIRMVEFSETSLIVTLFTRVFGRVSAIAKGARRPKGPFEGAIDLLGICHCELLHKSNDSLDILTEAKLARRFRGAQKTLPRLYCGYYIAEMLNRWTNDDDPHPDLYDLSVATIERIDGTGDPIMAVTYFDARALRMLGHSPATSACVTCGDAVDRSPARVAFGYEQGGVLCVRCRSTHQGVAMIQSSTLAWLDRLTEAPEIPQERFDDATYRPIRALLNRYITISLGVRPRTQSMLPTRVAVE